jgi:hypothetical protein
MKRTWGLVPILITLVVAGCGSSNSTPTHTSTKPVTSASFLSSLKQASNVASTVPANGDVNPYGIAQVTSSAGKLQAGQFLVSNFNDKANDQGTGTTIVQVSEAGTPSLFAQIKASSLPGACPGGVGLTTALAILPGGYVVVGSLPTTNGMSATAKYGCLIVLNDDGTPVSTISGPNIEGPWDMASVSHGADTSLFVSNALNGGAKAGIHQVDNSTVVRINLVSAAGQAPKVTSQQVIANDLPWVDNASALVIGPTGVALGANGTLYLANTAANEITAVPDALTATTPAAGGGSVVSTGGDLNQPLGLEIAPNGDLISANAGDGNFVETTPAGQQVAKFNTKQGAGSLFGFVVEAHGLYFVDDANNTLQLLH